MLIPAMSIRKFDVVARDGAARRGVIRTLHGEMETPGFFAVATRAALKGLDPRAAAAAGVQALICNGYHLAVQPGPDAVAEAGGLGRRARDRFGRLPGVQPPPRTGRRRAEGRPPPARRGPVGPRGRPQGGRP